MSPAMLLDVLKTFLLYSSYLRKKRYGCNFFKQHTVGPANREVPESAIAEQPLAQSPGECHANFHTYKQTNYMIKYLLFQHIKVPTKKKEDK